MGHKHSKLPEKWEMNMYVFSIILIEIYYVYNDAQ